MYVPDAASGCLATRSIAGRTLAVRNLVAALRAGASIIAVPLSLRDAAVERAVARMPALAAAVRWLEPGCPVPDAPPGQAWLLIPSSSLVDARLLQSLQEPGVPPQGVVLAPSAGGPAPVAGLPWAAIASLWDRFAAGEPTGADLTGLLRDGGAHPRESTGLFVPVRRESDLAHAQDALLSRLGIKADTRMDQLFHRRCSRWVTRLLVPTPLTPNLLSLVSLAIGTIAVWCFWRATPLSALWGVILYAAASVVDHADGEIARLTFQESSSGATLDWTVDTIIHSGVVLGMAVTAGGQLMPWVGLFAVLGVWLSALFASHLPQEIARGEPLGRLLKNLGNRDFFYLLLLSFLGSCWLMPSLLRPLTIVVALGSQAHWIACVAHMGRSDTSRPR
ncbi:MAG TPA: CDP-alcohol phosphatidyltransferase family protein [Methylomirabilota bacterium]|nr:CDP-alcohol phosphatidyltransferase family protein [Methylomirabilota bacterium]